MELKDGLTLAVATVVAIAGYLFKRLIDSKAESEDVKALIRQLESHVTSCDKRNQGIQDRLDTINRTLGQTREDLAHFAGEMEATNRERDKRDRESHRP